MADREKAIKGLKCCLNDDADCGWINGDNVNCPYNDNVDGCVRRMMADALALLETKTPRVMTLEEIWKLSPDQPHMWLELKDEHDETAFCKDLYCVTLFGIIDDLQGNEYASFATPGDIVDYPFRKYGKTWRCWTFFPNDVQRKDVKWDE